MIVWISNRKKIGRHLQILCVVTCEVIIVKWFRFFVDLWIDVSCQEDLKHNGFKKKRYVSLCWKLHLMIINMCNQRSFTRYKEILKWIYVGNTVWSFRPPYPTKFLQFQLLFIAGGLQSPVFLCTTISVKMHHYVLK